MEDSTYSYTDDLSESVNKSCDISISVTLAHFERLRISALTKAAEISPHVTEVTIGPRSPSKKTSNTLHQLPSTNNEEFIDLKEDKLGEDLRYTLLLKKYEAELQENSNGLYKNLVENMITTYAETMHRYWKKQSDECKKKALELRARKLQAVKLLQDKFNLNLLENDQSDEKKYQMINKQAIENMNRILDEQNKATTRFASITDSHTKICMCYNEITTLIQTEPQIKDVLDKYVLEINTIIQKISSIMSFCKTGTITDTEIQQSDILLLKIESIKQRISEDLDSLKHQECLRKEKEEEAKQKELEARKAQEAKESEKACIQQTVIEQAKRAQSMFYSEKNFAYYEELKIFLDSYESSYKDLLENNNLKKFRFDCQKAVNTPINALSSVSGVHIRDKYDKLSKLLSGEKIKVLDTYVIASQHPQGLQYCTALLAKKIVRQGDLLVSSNPEAAFPLAAVTVALWSIFPEFGKLLEAYFHKFCPYLVPMMLPQIEGQSVKEFYISRGYTYNDEGEVEKQDKFLKRMSGIFRLQCAIWIANTPKFIHSSNPCDLRYAWKWLASFINLKPEPDISATLLHDFFAVCGVQFLKYYGKQCIKIIKVINSEYLLILNNIDEGGPKTRLEVFLANILKTGIMPPPNGILPPNTW